MLTVGDAMLTVPKLCGRATVVADVRDLFQDDHVHCALVVDGGHLLSVVEPKDIHGADPGALASAVGALRGRTIVASADLDVTHRRMVAEGIRRLAVVSETGRILGLLCLKRSGTGFCSDEGVAARSAERDVFSPIHGTR